MKLITSVALTTPAITTRAEYRVENVSVMNCVLSPISATKTNINANQNAVIELEERFWVLFYNTKSEIEMQTQSWH